MGCYFITLAIVGEMNFSFKCACNVSENIGYKIKQGGDGEQTETAIYDMQTNAPFITAI